MHIYVWARLRISELSGRKVFFLVSSASSNSDIRHRSGVSPSSLVLPPRKKKSESEKLNVLLASTSLRGKHCTHKRTNVHILVRTIATIREMECGRHMILVQPREPFDRPTDRLTIHPPTHSRSTRICARNLYICSAIISPARMYAYTNLCVSYNGVITVSRVLLRAL